MGNLCSCMKPKHTEQEHPNRHSRHGPSDEVQSNGTSSPHSHQTQNTHTKTQHIKDRELPPDDEHLKNPADITKVDPIFKGKIDTDNRRSTIYLNTEDHLTCSSSTSNIIVDDSTVSKPNLKAMLKCLALAIYFHVKDEKNLEEDENKIPEIFDERIYPLTKERQSKSNEEISTPDHKDVYKFVRTLFTQAQLASEVVMVTLIYLERLLTYAEFDFGSTNWKRLTLGSIMLASKVWDDQAVWNVDFCMIINANVDDLNTLERSFLEILQFNVNVPGSVYAKYYFDLREMAFKYGIKFPRLLLTKERATKLEASSKIKSKIKFKSPKTSYPLPKFKRSFSLDFQRNGNFEKSRWIIS